MEIKFSRGYETKQTAYFAFLFSAIAVFCLAAIWCNIIQLNDKTHANRTYITIQWNQ